MSTPTAASTTLASPALPAKTLIWSESFDGALLLAPFLAGLTCAVIAVSDPRMYPIILLADLWFLGYHHVVATYTRLAFDSESLRRNRFFAVDLLLLVTVATMTVALTAGAWVIASMFLYLQWFHYMRQGYGISRMYFRATARGRVPGARDLAADLVIYLVPIYGIAHRSATMGDEFLGLPVKAIVLPDIVITALGTAAAVATAAWVLRTARAAARGEMDSRYTAFVASHVGIFLTAYVLTENVNVGWLAINVWHNLQYVLVVWMVNGKRYAGGIDPKARFLSTISQPGRARAYFGCCLAISTVIYFALDQVTSALLGGGVAAVLGIYMGINFHHYVVDAMIWKRRRVAAQTP